MKAPPSDPPHASQTSGTDTKATQANDLMPILIFAPQVLLKECKALPERARARSHFNVVDILS